MTQTTTLFSTERTYPCSCAAVFAAIAEPERLAVGGAQWLLPIPLRNLILRPTAAGNL